LRGIPGQSRSTREAEQMHRTLEDARLTEGRNQGHDAIINDDEVLVRLAVERYRVVYNGRLFSRDEVDAAGRLKFETCAVAVRGERATAVCESGLSPFEPEPTGRTFMLERADGGWAIRSIVVN
jgi:hypothetical protein